MSTSDLKPEEVVSKLGISKDLSEDKLFWLDELQEDRKEAESLEDKEIKGILGMRNGWSTCILILIVAIVLFDMLLVCFYGMGIWNFSDSAVVIAVITDNFLKIVGLGFLITRSLFERVFSKR